MLANQVPVSKIAGIIRTVLKCFNPETNVEELRLPKKSCASYMRAGELKTICDAHKATILHNNQAKGVYLNTDGTTKQQRKLGGVVANSIVLGVDELPDGKAISAIEDISREFEKLRKTAQLLDLPNPNSINWTLVVSSTSDSASAQKRVNKLIEKQRQIDEEKFGPATIETIDLIETFCSMHLGVNLRKAFLNGTVESDEEVEEPNEQKYRVDILVHEFCKLFGRTGVPEYALGVVSFPDFLELRISTCSNEDRAYYQACSKVHLHRQVGSRYFVSTTNGCKILFLKDAAIEFLKFSGKDCGNRLECDVYTKLQDSIELAHLKADSLMYYHVYGDLYMLSKSNDLGLSVLSMNQHYLELQTYLSEVENSPDIVFDLNYRVFQSEERLYGPDAKVNHHLKSPAVYQRLFDKIEIDSANLTSLLIKGASKMKEKLCSYAQKQLPGGCYWNPDQQIKDVLCQLKPSNDVCESILGLNDYLTTAIPNLNQMARSNLVQVKKNKTLKWLSNLSQQNQLAIVDLAVKNRQQVHKDYKDEEKLISEQRKQNMIQENAKREALKKKLHEEKEKLSQLHLIATPEELKEELLNINNEKISAPKKRNKK